jgi:prepilin-type N-terminal cleavage/methylation domain-containing protein
MHSRPLRDPRGFTLVEMLVALIVASIVGLSMVKLFINQHQAFLRQNEGVRATQNARAGVDMMARELRNAGYDPRGSSGAGITQWSADTFGWTADLNEDGDADDDDEQVAYLFKSGSGTLVRREGGTNVTIADGITGLTFAYFSDENGTVAAAATEIEQVGIAMTYETPESVMPGHLETQVALRNRIYE